MRLEVLVDQQEPLIFPLNKDKIIIGSGEDSDILLGADGISRKHVILYCGEDEFFVIDQGSTNGTFINEERLVPGKRVEFTSFFPVRLGDRVLLTLLSDEETSDLELSGFNSKTQEKVIPVDADQTRVINRSELRDYTNSGINAHRKKASVRARKSEAAKKKAPAKAKKKDQKESRFHQVLMFAAAILVFAIYYQVTNEEETFEAPIVAKVNTVEPINDPSAGEANQKVEDAIPVVEKEWIKSEEEISQIRADFKCMSEIEKSICQSLNLNPPYGAAQVRRDIIIFAPFEMDPKHAERLPLLYPNHKGPYPTEYYTTAFFSKNKLSFPVEYKEYRIHLYLYDNEDKKIVSLSFYPEGLDAFMGHSPERLLEDFLFGAQMVSGVFKEYFTVHE